MRQRAEPMVDRARAAACGLALACVAAAAITTSAIAQTKAPAKAPSTGWHEGRVTSVVDGDSLWFQPFSASSPVSAAGPNGKAAPMEVRIRQIDAPEICQAWGPQAKAALLERVGKQVVSVRLAGRDSHGRTLADVQVEGQDVARWLVVEGHAWSTRSKWDRGPLVKEERVARSLRRGLHAEGGAVEPRHFRKTNGACPR